MVEHQSPDTRDDAKMEYMTVPGLGLCAIQMRKNTPENVKASQGWMRTDAKIS